VRKEAAANNGKRFSQIESPQATPIAWLPGWMGGRLAGGKAKVVCDARKGKEAIYCRVTLALASFFSPSLEPPRISDCRMVAKAAGEI